jgi:site-specific DNA-cytosine methylase
MYKTIDLFAGIGGIRLGFETHNCKNVFSSEWDKDAQKMYQAKLPPEKRLIKNIKLRISPLYFFCHFDQFKRLPI